MVSSEARGGGRRVGHEEDYEEGFDEYVLAIGVNIMQFHKDSKLLLVFQSRLAGHMERGKLRWQKPELCARVRLRWQNPSYKLEWNKVKVDKSRAMSLVP
ncbi:ATP synthase epsilon chain 2 [Striga asiatica]|uniref:ATP synthase epsilon chain 2 n=1 Tax=Striga asiatica TaxID=4170 RepID=A0A5A7PAY4_STRAF|nr:ATP synthase epsilon chain 2 [Striga asiatica]